MTFPSLKITIPWYHANISDLSKISKYYWIIKILLKDAVINDNLKPYSCKSSEGMKTRFLQEFLFYFNELIKCCFNLIICIIFLKYINI